MRKNSSSSKWCPKEEQKNDKEEKKNDEVEVETSYDWL